MRSLRALLGALLLTLAPATLAEDWIYTVRPGDDLWTLARQYCGSARVAPELARYNELPNPAAIRAGLRLSFPVDWLVFEPSHAIVVSAEAGVERLTETGSRSTAQAGDRLDMGDVLLTNGGAALVRFADGSTLAIEPESRVLFNKLTAFGPAGMVDTHLRFNFGRGKADVVKQNRGDRFRIQTPEGIAAVRGTVLRIGRSPRGVTNTETLTGLVGFLQPQSTTTIPGGFGIAARADGVVKESLLPAPTWLSAPAAYGASAALEWQPLQGADRYVLSWVRPGTPEMVVASRNVRAARAPVDMGPGAWIVKLRGVSASGIEGQDASLAVTLLAAAPTGRTVAPRGGGARFEWQPSNAASEYVMTVRDSASGQELVETRRGTSADLDLLPGQYTWRVASNLSAPSTAEPFTVLPAAPTAIEVSRKGRALALSWDGDAAAEGYTVTLTGPDGATVTRQTETPALAVEVPVFGRYAVAVASEQRGLQSNATVKDVHVNRTPWWLLLFLAPLGL